MIRTRVLGLAIVGSLFFGFAPTMEAAPAAAPPRTVQISDFSANLTQVVLGSERRHVRREVRRFHRQERREVRRVHRQERRFVRRHAY